MTVPPGLSRPRRSAPSTMDSAIRSFMLPVGLAPSHFTKISAAPGSGIRSRRNNGVLPMHCSTFLTVYPLIDGRDVNACVIDPRALMAMLRQPIEDQGSQQSTVILECRELFSNL